MSHAAWSPERYERFAAERSRPFYDLLGLVRPRPDMRVVDLGCGTGELTRELHRRLQARTTIGIDSSQAMLDRSGAHAEPGLRFELQPIERFEPPEPVDLVFSNAALHWVPDHAALVRRLTGWLAEGGQLAVQVPANHDYASHLLAAEVAGEEVFRHALGGYRHESPVLPPEEYALALHRLGFREQCVRLQVYAHTLPSRLEVVDWLEGSLLSVYRGRLSEDLYRRFVERLRERITEALPDDRPFFFPYKRTLLWASR